MPHLYLVDGSSYIFRAFHVLPGLTNKFGLNVGAVYGYTSMLWKLAGDLEKEDGPTHLAVILDASESTFRNKMYDQYKANRPPPPPELVPQFPLIRDATRAFSVPCIEEDGLEADDIIACYVTAARSQGWNVTIVSSDKDLMQLIVENVIELYDPMKNRKLGPEAVMEKFGVGPDKVIDVQALIGDSTDNVPGAPGIGPKTAAELIGMFGSLDAILERANEVKQPKRRETLINHADQIRLSRTLVTLKDDVPVEEKWESFAVRDPEPSTLLQFIDALEFRTLGRRVREHFAKEKGVEIVASYAAGAAAPEPEPSSGPIVEEVEKEFKRDAYKCGRDLAAVEQYIARARRIGVVGIDTEADSFDAERAQLVGVSLALGANDAIYIPLAHRGSDPRAGELFASEIPLGANDASPLLGEAPTKSAEGERSDKQAPGRLHAPHPPAPALQAGGGDQLPLATALAILKPLLEDASVLKVGLNIKWDIRLFAKYGVTLAPYDDPLLISYALYGGLDPHDKTFLVEKHLGHGLMPLSDLVGRGKSQVSFDQVPVDRASQYSCEQSDAALRLWRKLKPELSRERLITVYETLERPLPPVL
ncbi:MAG TPA: 5'-3' exonuclease H3TH domain-containing protein, partial [Allosphingosinicella sp.]|nr:5'-3' exonuclease H3TH domain-containing protein [Allosphingosinicella sp.]